MKTEIIDYDQQPVRRPTPSSDIENDVPRDEWIERAVICSIIKDPHMEPLISEIVEQPMFHTPENGWGFVIARELVRAGNPVDAMQLGVSVGEAMGWKDLDASRQWATNVTDTLYHGIHGDCYARELVRTYKRRQIVLHAKRVRKEAFDPHYDPDDTLASLDAIVGELVSGVGKASAQPVGETLLSTLDMIGSPAQRRIHVSMDPLDSLIKGFRPGQLVIVGARPSMGKSAFAMNICDNVSRHNIPAGFISLEMSTEQLEVRLLSRWSRVPLGRFDEMGPQDKFAVSNAANERLNCPLIIDEDSRSLDDIVSSIRSMRRKHRVEIVVVDYIGLVTPPDAKAQREQQVAAISRRLKEIAKEQEITVIACAQLNRMLENRTTKRPQLADLRESGAIEQDADIVLFVHRPGRYDDGVDQREAEIIVAKQRQGDTGIAKLEWHGAYTEFVDPRGAF